MSSQEEISTTEQRIQIAENTFWHRSIQVRVCLAQLRDAQMSTEEGESKLKELLFDTMWDGEDYDEDQHGVRPEGADLKADVAVCGIGGCTLRIFQALNGSEITTGNCKAEGYCLKDKFDEVKSTVSVDEGRTLWGEVIDTCEPIVYGSKCPNLSCALVAGVSEDMVPGSAGDCAKLINKEV